MTRRYLVVDDNRAFAENVAEMLGDAGAEVAIACDVESALACLKTQRFDAVVTDMKLPGLSGADLIRGLRAVDRGVPVIVMSAFSHPQQLEEARRFGLLAFLGKPKGTPRLVPLLSVARRDAAVVLVQPDPGIAEALSDALRARGFTVCVVGDRAEFEALEVVPCLTLIDPTGAALPTLDDARARFPGTPVETLLRPFDTSKVVTRIEALVPR